MDEQVSTPNGQFKEFQCHLCSKIFNRKFTLEMHLLIHKGIKPHPCPFCGKCFRQKGTLMRHKALHSSSNLFHCSLCNRGFRQKNVFLHHLKHRHSVSTETLDRRKYRTQINDYQSIMDTLPPFVIADSTAISSSDKHLDALLFESFNNNNNACSNSSSNLNSISTANENSDRCLLGLEPLTFTSHSNSMSNSFSALQFECKLCFKVFADYSQYKSHIENVHNNNMEVLLDEKPQLLSVLSCSPDDNVLNRSSSKPLNFSFSPDTENKALKLVSENDLQCNLDTHSPKSCNSSENQPNLPIIKSPIIHFAAENNIVNNVSIDKIVLQKEYLKSKKSNLSFHDENTLNFNNSFKSTSMQSAKLSQFRNSNSMCTNPKKYDFREKKSRKTITSVSKRKLFSCAKCNKLFRSKISLEYHMQMHLHSKAFSCRICSKYYSNKQMLLCHTRSKHLKKLQCATCSRTFCNSLLYELHTKKCFKKLSFMENLPIVEIKKLLNSNSNDVIGVIPIKNPLSGKSVFGIPVFSLDSISKNSLVQ